MPEPSATHKRSSCRHQECQHCCHFFFSFPVCLNFSLVASGSILRWSFLQISSTGVPPPPPPHVHSAVKLGQENWDFLLGRKSKHPVHLKLAGGGVTQERRRESRKMCPCRKKQSPSLNWHQRFLWAPHPGRLLLDFTALQRPVAQTRHRAHADFRPPGLVVSFPLTTVFLGQTLDFPQATRP